MRYLGVLQNAYNPHYAGQRSETLVGAWFFQTPTTKRRLKFLRDNAKGQWVYTNTTPIFGNNAKSRLPVDEDHLMRAIKLARADVIVAFGRQAEAAVLKLNVARMLSIPHPASRSLTNELYEEAASKLKSGIIGRIALRQERGYVDEVTLADISPVS